MAIDNLRDKKIILGVSGGIAAYKCHELIRALVTAGAKVRVVLTQAATEFVTKLSLQTLSQYAVHDGDLLIADNEQAISHIELAAWAELVLVAPATANIIARIAGGLADDLLTTLILATTAPIALVPAMNENMWHNVATQANIALLQQRRLLLWGPAEGSQACGAVGLGRMLEPEIIANCCADFFSNSAVASGTTDKSAGSFLAGKKILITAGPTREALDPVRYLSNYSSGKMGYALAAVAVQLGAQVTLVHGPVALPVPAGVVKAIPVVSAIEMNTAVLAAVVDQEIFISTAAVSDYAPVLVSEHKIKKHDDTLVINMKKNPDILKNVTGLATPPITIGFAAETEDLLANAQHKLAEKNADMIIANLVTNGVFNSDDNEVLIVTKDAPPQKIAKTRKDALARIIFANIKTYWQRCR